MKNFKLLLLAFLAVSIVSCKSDDDSDGGGGDTSGNLIGTWIGVDLDYSGSTTTTADGLPPITADFVGETTESDYTLTFSEEPNEVVSDGSYTIELTTTILGETQTNTEDLDFFLTGTWTRDGNTLTISAEGRTEEYTIEELTDDSLILVSQTTEDLGDEELGLEIITEIDLRVIFTK